MALEPGADLPAQTYVVTRADLVRYADRLIWCLIGLPMGALAAWFLPRSDRRWTVLYLAIIPYLVIPFIAPAFPRYRLPAAPIVFVLAGQALACCWECRARRPEASAPEPVLDR